MTHPITISPNIQSGKPVFSNTRVPVKNLFDYLKTGHSLDEFLKDFPSVKKEQAIQVIEHFENLLNFDNTVKAKETSEDDNWNQYSKEKLSNAYGTDEPEYDLSMLQEPNPDYKK